MLVTATKEDIEQYMEFAYSLDVNSGLLSENEVKIRVRCQ